jgi:hypothetical protein
LSEGLPGRRASDLKIKEKEEEEEEEESHHCINLEKFLFELTVLLPSIPFLPFRVQSSIKPQTNFFCSWTPT